MTNHDLIAQYASSAFLFALGLLMLGYGIGEYIGRKRKYPPRDALGKFSRAGRG